MLLEGITYDYEDEITKLTQNDDVMKYVGNGLTWNEEKVKNFIKFNELEFNRKKIHYYYLIKEKDKFLGLIGSFYLPMLADTYFNIILVPEYQQQGLFSKLVQLLKNKILEIDPNVTKLNMLINVNHERMLHISKKHYYFNRKLKFSNNSFNEYSIFFRSYNYSFISSNTKSESVRQIFNKRGNWKEYDKKDFGKLDYFYIYGDYLFNNELRNRKCLLKNISDYSKGNITDKGLLFENLKKIPDTSQYTPVSYSIELDKLDIDKVKDFFQQNRIVIFKPVHGFQGLSISIFTSFDQFYQYIKSKKFIKEREKLSAKIYGRKKTNYWVLQKYIDNPLLMNDKKFHIRLYYLVYQSKKYLLNEGLIFLAEDKYKKEDYYNKKIHDTHSGDRYVDNVPKYPGDLKLSEKIKDDIWRQMLDLFEKIGRIDDFECYDESKDCYRIFGADVMITDNYQVKIIEINNNPGLPTINSKFGRKIFENEMSLIVDTIFPPKNKVEKKEDFILVYY